MKSLTQYIIEAFADGKGGDEFYTTEKDIVKELKNYSFKGMTVYCNYDDPAFSKFWKYFYENFRQLGLKHLIATYYDNDPIRHDYDGKTVKKTPIKSGDFRDNEDIIDECDIVVTNPPFSNDLPNELVKLVVEKHKKNILFLGPLMLAYKKYIFDFIKSGELHIGNNQVTDFDRPSGSEGKNRRVFCAWFTNLPIDKPMLKTGIKFDKNNAQYDDSGEYLICSKYKTIPDDYDKPIATSVNFINHLNYNQFEILGNKALKQNGKTRFKQILIKRK